MKSSSKSVSSVKLGEELHGPKDSMTISRSHITFTEIIKNTSQAVEAILHYKLGARIGDKKLKDFI